MFSVYTQQSTHGGDVLAGAMFAIPVVLFVTVSVMLFVTTKALLISTL